ncbi:MAG: hypothetical protein NT166_24415 [Candidatus Aminicenantes bacterium]|nr:hypothetical protein [Candidatus Aminicenantes bacterium]
MAKKEHEPIIELKVAPGEKMKISVLGNAVYFFFHRVFIITEKKGYRLIAIHKGELLVDARYKTSKGAKIAFLKLYCFRAWQEGVKPYWTDFYTPDERWVKKRFKFA